MSATIVQMLSKAESLGIDTRGMTDESGDPSFVFYMIACTVLEEAHGMTHENTHCQDCAEIAHSRNLLAQIARLDEPPDDWEEILRQSQFWYPDLNYPTDDYDYTKYGGDAPEAVMDALCGSELNHVCKTAHLLADVIFEHEEAS